jgi:MoaA/NifB/PqqE/SkfB family radical SAM enzyme
MDVQYVLSSWASVLRGDVPLLSIEITRECPLRCPGCYAYGDDHLGGGVTLREVRDLKGQALVDGVLGLVDRHRPVHLSIVGGEPLVRMQELTTLLPLLAERGIHVQIVTSAVRDMPLEWNDLPRFSLAVSIDGLQPEHDARRTPATYERILKNIEGHRIAVHCTITRQQVHRPGYIEEFLDFWSARPEVERIWYSLYTPQIGERSDETLLPADRSQVINDLRALRGRYPKLLAPNELLAVYAAPPQSPDACVFARMTETISADLTTRISPCQFGGSPDCSNCGCAASAGLAAVGRYRMFGVIPLENILNASMRIGQGMRRLRPDRAVA